MGFNSGFKGLSIAPFVPNLGIRRSSVFDFRPRPFYPWALNPVLIEKDVMWAPESLWTIWKIGKFLAEASIRTPVRPVRNIVTTPIYPVSDSMNVCLEPNVSVNDSVYQTKVTEYCSLRFSIRDDK